MAALLAGPAKVAPITQAEEQSIPTIELDARDGRKDKAGEPLVFRFIDRERRVPHMTWKDLSFSVETPLGKRDILRDVSGQLLPGELTCILGPSGSGKTSLLNILAGRVRAKAGSQIGGTISIDGMTVEPANCQHLFGYVMQEDALFGTATPREILAFSAALRLGINDKAAVHEVIQDMLVSLGLQQCADSMVGDELIKGISGGEKKRTAIGQELITNPHITFLDEPTSGLDSEAAYSVVQVLKKLTRAGQSVMCTIHSPSSETFYSFDKAIFLARGGVIYAGPLNQIRTRLAALSQPCPQSYNPADFLLFMSQRASDATLNRLAAGVKPEAIPLDAGVERPVLPKPSKGKGFCTELRILAIRESQKIWRDKASLLARFGSTTFLTLAQGLIFFQIGSPDQSDSTFVQRDAYDFQSHNGALTMVGISAMFGVAQPVLLTFTAERPVFLRERACNTYHTVPYFLSKTVTETPLVILQILWLLCIAYPMMGMQGSFLVHWMALVAIAAVSASTSLALGCFVKHSKAAVEISPMIFIPQILFAGLFIAMESIPVWLRWIQYICALKWGMNILLISEFEHTRMGERLFERNNIDTEATGAYFGVLLALWVCFRCLAAFGLAQKAKALYN